MHHIHCLFMIIAGIGVVLKIAYLVKYADKKILHKYAKWTLIIGIIGALVTGVIAMKHGKKYHKYKHGEHYEMMKEKGKWHNKEIEEEKSEEAEGAGFDTIDDAPGS